MTVTLTIDDRELEGFEEGSVRLTLDEAVNDFEVTYVAGGHLAGERMIYPGDAVEIAIDGETILGGYVDETDEQDDPGELRLRAIGRSKAGDLADCSSITAPGSWSGVGLDVIVADLCEPFGISVYFDESPGAPFEAFSVQKGESVYDTIARGAAKRHLIVYSVGADLVLGHAGQYQTRTVLERGVNVQRAARNDSRSNRYSQYVFRGQGRPDENSWGKRSQQLEHIVVDDAITRYRPLRVTAEAHSGLDLKGRAELERNQRAGKGERVTCTVEGHHTVEGAVWRPNTLVRFVNPTLGVDATLVVVSARFRFGANAPTVTELDLTRPEAYDRLAKYPAMLRGQTWT